MTAFTVEHDKSCTQSMVINLFSYGKSDRPIFSGYTCPKDNPWTKCTLVHEPFPCRWAYMNGPHRDTLAVYFLRGRKKRSTKNVLEWRWKVSIPLPLYMHWKALFVSFWLEVIIAAKNHLTTRFVNGTRGRQSKFDGKKKTPLSSIWKWGCVLCGPCNKNNYWNIVPIDSSHRWNLFSQKNQKKKNSALFWTIFLK